MDETANGLPVRDGRGLRALRLLAATAMASALTVLAIMGVVHLAERILPVIAPSPIVVSDARLDFGRVLLHEVVVRELLVRNDGKGPLRTRFLVPGGAYSVEPEEIVLHPGVEWRITLVATPDREGPMIDVLQIEVPDEPIAAVVVPLAGEAGGDSREAKSQQEMSSA
jgi:hypothetical protein